MDLKTKHRKLSIPDVIGYIIAKKYSVKFLTGDEDFKDLDNVEFRFEFYHGYIDIIRVYIFFVFLDMKKVGLNVEGKVGLI